MSAGVLELDRISKQYRKVTAVTGLDLELADGEMLALVGPSGCGKSTALRLVAGLEAPDSGRIRIGRELVAGDGAWRSAERRRVGIVFQDHALFPHLTVAGNVAFGLDGWAAARRRERVATVLDLVELGELSARYPHELSGGEQQRVALARALAPEPALVLLDEPFSNLDRNLRAQIRTETVAILRSTGTAAVFVTHDQAEALATGDRVGVMRDGRIEQVGPPEEVFHAPANRFVATFMGEADFLPARVSGAELVTEAGSVPTPTGLDGHTDVEVMVRPHEVTLRAAESGPARVVGAEFQGAFVLYTVVLASGRTVRSLQPHTAAFTSGTPLVAELAHGHRPAILAGDESVAVH
ncbi:MAG: ATP-binding cassette domain-containing protein [Pseudonocardiaceae bacterium]|nr:ATP-binding cassette domain-containing protein [Pseudonocardiaceae bacterium]